MQCNVVDYALSLNNKNQITTNDKLDRENNNSVLNINSSSMWVNPNNIVKIT